MTSVCNVVGARPNFMKMAPVVVEMQRRGMSQFLVHTGQHYDHNMSALFFKDLCLPAPDVYLGIGSGSHAEQTARIMMAFENVCLNRTPSLVVVAGDVNSTLACALVAAKLQIPLAHIEAGLRSFDQTMPEETNRVLTDHIAELHLATEPSGRENLLREGIPEKDIFFVGNCMIDSLSVNLTRALQRRPWERFNLTPGSYGIVTLHRPTNVDNERTLREIAAALQEICAVIPLFFPVHPRTRARIESADLGFSSIQLIEPLGYLDFLGLMAKARLVLTDSGGIQEETTALGVPCVTLRHNTERPVTLYQGTNRLAGNTRAGIVQAARAALSGDGAILRQPDLWDGKAACRVVDVIERWLSQRGQKA